MIYRVVNFFLILLLVHVHAMGQEKRLLTLDEVIQGALQRNYNVRLSQNEEEIAINNEQQARADFYPSFSIVGNGNRQDARTSLKINSSGPGQPARTINGQQATNYNYAIQGQLDFVVWQGLSRWNTLNQRKTAVDASQLSLIAEMQNVALNVLSAYYRLVNVQANVEVAEEALRLSRERVERQQTRKDFGQANTLEVLSAEVDLNADSINLIQQQQLFQQAYFNLTYLINAELPPVEEIKVKDTIPLGDSLSLAELQTIMKEDNPTLLLAKTNIGLSGWQLEVARSFMQPRFSLTTEGGYTGTEQEIGVLQYNRALGVTYGAAINWNVFDGLQQKTNVQNAKVEIENAQISLEETENRLTRELKTAYSNFILNRQIMYRQQANLSTAQLNFEQANERYNLGQATNTQLREAQLNLVRTKFSYENSRYNAKLAELQLMSLTGNLVELEE